MTNECSENNKATAWWANQGGGGRVDSVSGTHKRFADPVILIVKDVAVPIKQISEELPQVVIIRLLEEVQPPHVAQVGGHLFCNQREHFVKWEQTGIQIIKKKEKKKGNWLVLLTREALTKHFNWCCSFGVPNFLIPLLQSVSLGRKETHYTQNCEWITWLQVVWMNRCNIQM